MPVIVKRERIKVKGMFHVSHFSFDAAQSYKIIHN